MERIHVRAVFGSRPLAVAALIVLIGMNSGCGGDGGSGPSKVDGWQAVFGGTTSEAGNDVLVARDGNYVVLGVKSWFGAGSYDVYLLKMDPYGALLWDRSYFTYETEYGRYLAETEDGGFLIAASRSPSTLPGSLNLTRTDSAGTVVWEKRYENAPGPSGMALCADGGAVISGTLVDEGDSDTISIYALKIDGAGGIEWEFTDRTSELKSADGICRTADGGFVICGSSGPPGAAKVCGLIMKLDQSGHLVWERPLPGEKHCFLSDVVQTADGGYVAAGYIGDWETEFDIWSADLYVVKTDALGHRLWDRTTGIGVDEWFESVTLAPDGGYVFAGSTLSTERGWDAVLLKVNSGGETVWQRSIGGANDDYGVACTPSADGGYILVGGTASYGSGGFDVYVVKTDALGRTTEKPAVASARLAGLNPTATEAPVREPVWWHRRSGLRR